MERKGGGAVSELMGECDGRRSIIALVKGEVIAAIVRMGMKGVDGIGEG